MDGRVTSIRMYCTYVHQHTVLQLLCMDAGSTHRGRQNKRTGSTHHAKVPLPSSNQKRLKQNPNEPTDCHNFCRGKVRSIALSSSFLRRAFDRLLSFITMVSSSSSSSSSIRIGHLHKAVSSRSVRRCLRQRVLHEPVAEVVFCRVNFDADEHLAEDLREVLLPRRFARLKFVACTGLATVMDAICEACGSLTISAAGVGAGNDDEDDAVATYTALNAALRANTTLHTVRLWNADLTVDARAVNGCEDDEESSLFSNLRYNRTLQHLDLSRSHLGCATTTTAGAAAALGRALRDGGQQLRSLNLSECHLDDESLARILRDLPPSLRCLNASRNVVGCRSLSALADALSRPECRLRSLSVREGVRVPDECAGGAHHRDDDDEALTRALRALRANASLRRLDVSGNAAAWGRDDHAVVRELLDGLPSTLRELDLSDSGLTVDGVAVVADRIPRLRPRLSALRVWEEGDDDDHTNDDDDVVTRELLERALHENTSLIDLGDDVTRVGTLAHVLNVNRAGRCLLTAEDDHSVPAGLWSTVMAKCVRDDNVDGLFGLLRQGALLGR